MISELSRRETLRSWIDLRGPASYELSKESFEVFVPASYRPERPFGLFVWISAGPAELPAGWAQVFTQNRIIWVSANNTGNDRDFFARVGLQLDAAHNMARRYNIDPQRLYIGGFSGGGMTAELLIRSFPDVFSGGFCMAGGLFYGCRTDDETAYPTVSFLGAEWSLPRLREEFRLVLLTGEADFNGRELKAAAESFRLDDFKHVTYLQVPGIGHAIPSAPWLEKGLLALDRGKAAATQAAATRYDDPPANGAFLRNGQRPLPAHDPEAQAQRLLNTARSAVENSYFELARPILGRILAEYPATAAVRDARQLLERMDYIQPSLMPRDRRTGVDLRLLQGRVALDSNMHDAARLYFDRIVMLDPDTPNAREARAWLEWMEHNPTAARTRPTDPAILAGILYHTAIDLSARNMTEQSRNTLQRIIKDYPQTVSANEARKLLNKPR